MAQFGSGGSLQKSEFFSESVRNPLQTGSSKKENLLTELESPRVQWLQVWLDLDAQNGNLCFFSLALASACLYDSFMLRQALLCSSKNGSQLPLPHIPLALEFNQGKECLFSSYPNKNPRADSHRPRLDYITISGPITVIPM